MKKGLIGGSLFIILIFLMTCSYGNEGTVSGAEESAFAGNVAVEATTQAFVDETLPSYSKLAKFGIITGDEKGDLLLDKTITRAEMTIVFLRMLGLEEVAKNNSSETGFADQMAIPSWAQPYVAYARTNGLIHGDEFGIFNAMGKISGEEFAVIVRKALGYRTAVKWTENIATLQSETGIFVPDKQELIRAEIFEVLWDVFSKNVKNGGGSLMRKSGDF